jgi:hypothetical protein
MIDETTRLMVALTAALDLSSTGPQRHAREKLADLSRQVLEAQAVIAEAQPEIELLSDLLTQADLAVTKAEQALAAHLNAKHVIPAAEGPA